MTMTSTTTSMTTSKKTLISDLSYHSMYDGDSGGSMGELLQRAGLRSRHSSNIEHADIIVFNGGADIGTSIYHEKPLFGGIPVEPSVRDKAEMDVFARFEGSNKLLLGICRGAQLLNCLNGGTLWQDVTGHGRDHVMVDLESGHRIPITSTHHQMMRPNYSTAKIIGVADEATRKDAERDHYPYNSYPDDHKDAEVVWYRNTRSLCIQGHPEYVPGSLYSEYCLTLISNCLEEVRRCAA